MLVAPRPRLPNRATDHPAEPIPGDASFLTSPRNAQLLVRTIHGAAQLQLRSQFSAWSQGSLQAFVPHELAVCGAYLRARRQLVYEAFGSVPLDPQALAIFSGGASAWMQQLIGAWAERRGRALVLDLRTTSGAAAGAERDRLVEAGFDELLVHGVARPQRPAELESLFIFGARHGRCSTEQSSALELLMPHLHAAWLRVQSHGAESDSGAFAEAEIGALHPSITEREIQILVCVREGKSNQQIGSELGISVLTVKNHVQKILRKLGASNRAHAVAVVLTGDVIALEADTTAAGA